MKRIASETIFRFTAATFAYCIPLILGSIVIMLLFESRLSLAKLGLSFIYTSVWDPVADVYGAWPFIYGTMVSSFIALLLALPLGLGAAIYLTEVSKSKIVEWFSLMIEMLAAIPSVIYGLWGIFVLGPWLANYVEPFLKRILGFLPIFQGPFSGLSMFSGGVILAIMILPTITAVSREVFQAVPQSLRESSLALGSTKWECFKMAVFGPATSGIIGAVILGLGRAMGETMAVTMVIGNRPQVSASLFAPAYTLASVIANEFAEAVTDLNLSVLIEIALVLLVMTLMVNALARILIWKTVKKDI